MKDEHELKDEFGELRNSLEKLLPLGSLSDAQKLALAGEILRLIYGDAFARSDLINDKRKLEAEPTAVSTVCQLDSSVSA